MKEQKIIIIVTEIITRRMNERTKVIHYSGHFVQPLPHNVRNGCFYRNTQFEMYLWPFSVNKGYIARNLKSFQGSKGNNNVGVEGGFERS